MTPGRTRVMAAAEGGLIFPKRALAEAAGVSVAVMDGLVDEGTLEAVAMTARPSRPRPDPDHAHAVWSRTRWPPPTRWCRPWPPAVSA